MDPRPFAREARSGEGARRGRATEVVRDLSDAEHVIRFDLDGLEVMVIDLDLPPPELAELTQGEREVALSLADGLRNAEIAAQRGVTPKTIANQARSIFQKLKVCSRWELALLVTRRSLEPRVRPEVSAPSRGRPSGSPRPRSGILNSPATVRQLRESYSQLGADFHETRTRRGIRLVHDGALHREDYCALFEELAAATERPALGLELACSLPPGGLGLLEWLSGSAPTLGEGLAAVSAYGDLLHHGGRRVTCARGDELIISYSVDGMVAPRVVVDWSFGCLYERVRAIAGAEIEPIEVRVQYEDPRDGRTEAYFRSPVRFGACVNEIVLPREVSELPLASADAESFALLSGVARRRIEDASRPTLVTRTRHAMTGALESGEPVRLPAVARRLGLSARALERGLEAAGQRFDGVLATCRIDHVVATLERIGAAPAVSAELLRALAGSVATPTG